MTEIKRMLLGMITWGILVVCAGWLSHRQHLLPGFSLGFLASLCYYALLSFRVKRSAEVPLNKTVVYMRIGWLIRLSFIVLALILALIMPGIDFLSAVIGLFSFQIVMLIQATLLVVTALSKSRAGSNSQQSLQKKE